MTTECQYEPCDRDVIAKGLCMTHYQQRRRGKELAPIQEPRRKPNESYCLTCDTQKAREDFYIRPNGRLQNECKACVIKRVNERRRKRQACED